MLVCSRLETEYDVIAVEAPRIQTARNTLDLRDISDLVRAATGTRSRRLGDYGHKDEGNRRVTNEAYHYQTELMADLFLRAQVGKKSCLHQWKGRMGRWGRDLE